MKTKKEISQTITYQVSNGIVSTLLSLAVIAVVYFSVLHVL